MEDQKDQLLGKGDYHIEKWRLQGEIPLIIWAKSTLKKKPVVIFHHGYGASKEQLVGWAPPLAEAGFLVVLPDAHHHGESRDPEFGAFEASNRENFPRESLIDMAATIEKDKFIINFLKKREDVQKENIGIAGNSMGGHISLAAIPLYKEIKAAVIIAGAAEWETLIKETNLFDLTGWKRDLENQIGKKERELLRKYEPIRYLNRYPPIPILFLHGAEDKIVPINCIEKFYKKIRPFYPPGRIKFKKLPGLNHSTLGSYKYLVPDTIDWLKRFCNY